MQSDEKLETYFKEIFILLEPRDIVSGDFYWYLKIDNKIILTVADCTGHGVPGAFMSLLGINSLKEITINEKITKPNLVLNRLRQIIKIALNQSLEGNYPKDGMDLAYCVFDIQNMKAEYSVANNSIYLFRNNELIQYESTRNPIGIYLNEKDFINHEFDIYENDVIYLFTDGYYSQFGGEKNEKFKINNFRELLKTINMCELSEQKNILKEKFDKWKGNDKQIDDILIIGVKI